MKKLSPIISILLVILPSSIILAQDVILPKDSATGKIKYTEVVRVDSANADQLYIRSRIWITETFKDAKEVIQMDDKIAHILIGKGSAKAYFKGTFGELYPLGYFNYLVRVDCKDGRYKYTITDFTCTGEAGTYPAEGYEGKRKNYVYARQQINDIASGLISSLKASMEKSLTIKSQGDW